MKGVRELARITCLEDALHDDVDGTVRAMLLSRLGSAEGALRARLRLPLTAPEYPAAERCLAAIEASRETIECVWRRYHGGVPQPWEEWNG
jgi:type III secretion system YseE family protein